MYVHVLVKVLHCFVSFFLILEKVFYHPQQPADEVIEKIRQLENEPTFNTILTAMKRYIIISMMCCVIYTPLIVMMSY